MEQIYSILLYYCFIVTTTEATLSIKVQASSLMSSWSFMITDLQLLVKEVVLGLIIQVSWARDD